MHKCKCLSGIFCNVSPECILSCQVKMLLYNNLKFYGLWCCVDYDPCVCLVNCPDANMA